MNPEFRIEDMDSSKKKALEVLFRPSGHIWGTPKTKVSNKIDQLNTCSTIISWMKTNNGQMYEATPTTILRRPGGRLRLERNSRFLD